MIIGKETNGREPVIICLQMIEEMRWSEAKSKDKSSGGNGRRGVEAIVG